MQYSWSTVMVKNMEKSLAFYKDFIGLEVVSRMDNVPGVDLAFLGTGETQIELVCTAESAAAVAGNMISFGFEVGNLDNALKLVREKGIPIVSEVITHPTIRYFFVLDPNGVRILLKESMKR
jgi:lactoylglutathione lyase